VFSLGNTGADERIRTADLLITKSMHADCVDGTGRFAQETYSAVQPSPMNPAQMVVKMVVKSYSGLMVKTATIFME